MIPEKIKKLKNKDNHTEKPKSRSVKYQILKGDLEELNFEKEYGKLKSMLSLEVNRANYDKLLELIDNVTEYARIAGSMYAGSKEVYEDYKTGEYAIWWARASNDASRILEKMKKNKIISGQISEEKIRNWIIENRTEEYEKKTKHLNDLKFAVDMMKVLYEQWESRKSLLQTQANVIEKRKVVVVSPK